MSQVRIKRYVNYYGHPYWVVERRDFLFWRELGTRHTEEKAIKLAEDHSQREPFDVFGKVVWRK